MRYRSGNTSAGEVLVAQAASLVGVFDNQGDYHPFKMRW